MTTSSDAFGELMGECDELGLARPFGPETMLSVGENLVLLAV